MLNRLVLGIYIVALASGWVAPPQSTTTSVLNRTVTLAEIGYTPDETLQGVLVTRDYTIHWPDAWQPQPGNKFILRFNHYAGLEPHSSMAVDLNGTRVGSVLLTPENAADGVLQVDLPENEIKVGYNQIHISLYMGIQDNYCSDIDNPALWLTIHDSSSFEFSYAAATPDLNLANFPVPFVDNSELIDNSVTFVLPASPNTSELDAAAAISAKIGQQAAWRKLIVNVISPSDSLALDTLKGDVVVIGKTDRLSANMAKLPFISSKNGAAVLTNQNGDQLPPEAGVLWEQVSPTDPTAVQLYVTGLNDQAVSNAALALANSFTYPLLSGPMGVILAMPKNVAADQPFSQSVSLAELGYKDITAQGSREQSIDYVLTMPLSWHLQKDATLDLHFAHSALLLPKSSTLNISLNDTPVGSILLDSSNTTDAHSTFNLPARLFQAGDNTLTVTSDMELQKDQSTQDYQADCLHKNYNEAWLVAYSDSNFNLPGGPSGQGLTLADYPRGFFGSGNFSDLAFVVGNSPDINSARAIVQIANRLGHFTTSSTLSPRVIDAKTLEKMSPPIAHQILIGLPSKNTAIQKINSQLPLPFQAGTDKPTQLETIPIVAPGKTSQGYLQSIGGPAGQSRLIVTGNTDEGVLWGSQVLNNPDLFLKLSGDLAILNGADNFATVQVHALPTLQPAQNPVPEASANSPVSQRPVTWILWLSAGIFLLTFIILIGKALQGARLRAKTGGDHGA